MHPGNISYVCIDSLNRRGRWPNVACAGVAVERRDLAIDEVLVDLACELRRELATRRRALSAARRLFTLVNYGR